MQNTSKLCFAILASLSIALFTHCNTKKQSSETTTNLTIDSTDYQVIAKTKEGNLIDVYVVVKDPKKARAVNDLIKDRFKPTGEDKDKSLTIQYFDNLAAAKLESGLPYVGYIASPAIMDTIRAHRYAGYSAQPSVGYETFRFVK